MMPRVAESAREPNNSRGIGDSKTDKASHKEVKY